MELIQDNRENSGNTKETERTRLEKPDSGLYVPSQDKQM